MADKTRSWVGETRKRKTDGLLQVGWIIGISAILLVLYLTEPKPNIDKDWFDYYFESFAVISLITYLPQNVDSQAPP